MAIASLPKPLPVRRREILIALCTLLVSCGGEGQPSSSAAAMHGATHAAGMSAGAMLQRHVVLETTVVANPVPVGTAGDSPNDQAALARSAPVNVTVDAAGNLYITQRDKSIRKITSQSAVSLQASEAGMQTTQPAASLLVAVDEVGNVQVTDRENCSMRWITPTGTVTTTTLPKASAGVGCSAMGAAPRQGWAQAEARR